MAHEVMGVKLGAHGGNAASQDGLLTGLTHAAPRLVVVGFTEGLSFVFKKAPVHKGAVTLSTNKTLRVPEGVEG